MSEITITTPPNGVLEWIAEKDAEIERLRAENEALLRFICRFGHADLDDMAADAITVGMVFQGEAKRIAKDAGWEMGPYGDPRRVEE